MELRNEARLTETNAFRNERSCHVIFQHMNNGRVKELVRRAYCGMTVVWMWYDCGMTVV